MIICSRAAATIISNLSFPDLKIIQLTSTGYDGVPIKKFKDKGIIVTNVGSVYSIPIAETVVYGFLRMAKRLRNSPQSQRQKLRNHFTDTTSELANKKLMILGTGNIGKAAAKRLNAMDMEISGYNLHGIKDEPFKEIITSKSDLLNKLNLYDYILSTLPASDETKNFCDSEFFKNMKKSAVFFNVGRNATVDNDALFNALKNHMIGGAVIDNPEFMPLKIFNRFRKLDNTFVMPGIANATPESTKRMKEMILQNIRLFIGKSELNNIIN